MHPAESGMHFFIACRRLGFNQRRILLLPYPN